MTSSWSIVAVVDDLTGAIEVGAKFAAYGLPAIVTTDVSSLSEEQHVPVVVIDTETRHLNSNEAAERTSLAAAFACRSSARLIYKKTDSTLRGNIGVEFRAMQRIFPTSTVIYAPAYPEMGRTVKDGQLFVYGIPVHQTEFADDLLNPVRDCTIRGVLGDAEALVLDGECDADTEAAAERILEQSPPQICAGPAALAQALARRLGPATEPAVSIPLLSRCLVINGSLHPVSIRQMEAAEQQGLFDDHWQRLDNKDIEGSGAERARHTGNCVRRILSSSRFDALIVFGGDTVFGIHQALGAPPFEALGEIAPGVPLSTAGGLVWITKAGGFGPPDVLSIIKKRLT